jgi:predicted transcriptional regulator
MDSQITFRIDQATRDRIQELADARKWTFSQMARELLEQALAQFMEEARR